MRIILGEDVRIILGEDVRIILGEDVRIILGEDVRIILGEDLRIILGKDINEKGHKMEEEGATNKERSHVHMHGYEGRHTYQTCPKYP